LPSQPDSADIVIVSFELLSLETVVSKQLSSLGSCHMLSSLVPPLSDYTLCCAGERYSETARCKIRTPRN